MVNSQTILGRLGQDPELNYTNSGAAVCNLRVATGDSYTKSDGTEVDTTEWHTVVLWDRQAENAAKYLEKGSLVYVEGRTETREWEDRDGNTRRTKEVRAIIIKYVGGTSGGGNKTSGQKPRKKKKSSPNKPKKQQSFDAGSGDDDLPF